MSTAASTFYADLHIHSRYSRATSKHCDLENLSYWGRRKGIAVVGTGDFTHPKWRAELRDKLVPAEPGLFRLRGDLDRAVCERVAVPGTTAPRFMLSVEISTIYKQGDKVRKVHHLIYAPDFESVDRVVARLSRIGNLHSDGRPILGLDSRDLLEIVLESGEHSYLVPAHVWTPWFSVLGSRSGFDEVEACYGDLGRHIFAIETGLSSDPLMNWRLSRLDRYTLVSNSDAHSPAKLGREACVFHTELDYFAMRRALETRTGYGGTLEFFPEEGKYHLDGHRKCGVVLEPEETQALDGRCPVCEKPLTVGVMHRVMELADRPYGFRPAGAPSFRSLVPLPEVLAEIVGTGSGSKAVGRSYDSLLTQVGSELFILDDASVEDLRRAGHGQVAEAVARMRAGQVIRKAGFDGEYGVIRLFEDNERKRGKSVSLRLALPEPPAPPAPSTSTSEPDVSSGPTPSTQPGSAATPASSVGPGANHPARTNPAAPAGSVATPVSVAEPDAGAPARASSATPAEDAAPAPAEPACHIGAALDAHSATRPRGSAAAEHGSTETAESAPASAVLAGLDPDQRRAAGCVEGPLLIVAVPGTGKTRTLTHRIAHLVTDLGAPPSSCLAITFTNRAAEEMRERLAALLPPQGPAGAAEAAARVAVMTFHGLALTILRENRQRAGLHRGFRIAGDAERVALVAETQGCTPRKARGLLARFARSGITRTPRATDVGPGEAQPAQSVEPSAALPRSSGDMAAPVCWPAQSVEPSAALPDELMAAFDAYRAALERASLVDFDELLVRAVTLLGSDDEVRRAYRDRFPYVSIDEYQDIDELQYRLIALLCAPWDGDLPRGSQPARSLCAIGDPDQAIYGFRGADVGFFLRFRDDFAGAREVHLTRNYRSTRTIVDAAMQAIAPATLIAGRVLRAVRSDAEAADAGHVDDSDPGALGLARVHLMECASERAEAERVVHTIEAMVGGTSFFSVDSGRVGHAGGTDLGFADFAILYRSDAQVEPLREALARSGIPFQKRSHLRLADDPLIQALTEDMRAHIGAADETEGGRDEPPLVRALRRAADSLKRRASAQSDATSDEASDDAAAPRAEPTHALAAMAPGPVDAAAVIDMLSPLARRCGDDLDRFLTELAMDSEVDLWDPRADRVSLLTLHAAKGLEFRVVFLVGCEDGVLPLRWSSSPPAGAAERQAGDDDGGEERRLFFVGMTRARELLCLTHARKRRRRGQLCELPLSPFVRDIAAELLAHQRRSPGKRPRMRPHEQLGLF